MTSSIKTQKVRQHVVHHECTLATLVLEAAERDIWHQQFLKEIQARIKLYFGKGFAELATLRQSEGGA